MGDIVSIATMGVGAVVALFVAPGIVKIIGFTGAGIAAGSQAATMMAILGGAATQAGGIVATLQAIGALSTAFIGGPAAFVIGGIGAAVAAIVSMIF